MTSQKCPNCGLVNFATEEICKRCGINLHESPVETEETVYQEEQENFKQYAQPEYENRQDFATAVPSDKKPTTPDIICGILWLLLIPILLMDFLFLSSALATANGAPQQAAGAAMAAGYAVIPYCAVRALTEAIRSFSGK
jgi:uncharacterized Zn finger protein (UPF0148 family)